MPSDLDKKPRVGAINATCFIFMFAMIMLGMGFLITIGALIGDAMETDGAYGGGKSCQMSSYSVKGEATCSGDQYLIKRRVAGFEEKGALVKSGRKFSLYMYTYTDYGHADLVINMRLSLERTNPDLAKSLVVLSQDKWAHSYLNVYGVPNKVITNVTRAAQINTNAKHYTPDLYRQGALRALRYLLSKCRSGTTHCDGVVYADPSTVFLKDPIKEIMAGGQGNAAGIVHSTYPAEVAFECAGLFYMAATDNIVSQVVDGSGVYPLDNCYGMTDDEFGCMCSLLDAKATKLDPHKFPFYETWVDDVGTQGKDERDDAYIITFSKTGEYAEKNLEKNEMVKRGLWYFKHNPDLTNALPPNFMSQVNERIKQLSGGGKGSQGGGRRLRALRR